MIKIWNAARDALIDLLDTWGQYEAAMIELQRVTPWGKEPDPKILQDAVRFAFAHGWTPGAKLPNEKAISLPIDGWINVYTNGLSHIWADASSAIGAMKAGEDITSVANVGKYMRTVRINEVSE